MTTTAPIPMPTTGPPAEQRLRASAQELVGQVFYGTLLRQVRDSSLKGKYGHGGRGEEAFAAQLHEELASRAGRAQGNQLTEAIVDRFLGQSEVAARFRNLQHEARASMMKDVSGAIPRGER